MCRRFYLLLVCFIVFIHWKLCLLQLCLDETAEGPVGNELERRQRQVGDRRSVTGQKPKT